LYRHAFIIIINPLGRARGKKTGHKANNAKRMRKKTQERKRKEQCSANPNNKGRPVMLFVVPVPLYELKHHSS
jgi:hypothetical protein